MKKILLTLLIILLPVSSTSADCGPKDVLIVGDSQTGASWSKSYLGNFIPLCLKGSYAMYGRGGTIPAQWMNQSNMDHIETIQRTQENEHQNIGSGQLVPVCKKRIGPMLDSHTPQKVIFQFGGNMIYLSDTQVTKQIDDLMLKVVKRGIEASRCIFVTPTFEMEVESNRNVPARNLKAVLKVNKLIREAIKERCQVLDGVELMKDSVYFDGKEFLKREPIPGMVGCGGAATNDNVHVCGFAAQDWADKICEKINK